MIIAADVAMPWLVKVVIDLITEGPGPAQITVVFREVLWMCGLILGVALVQYVATAILNAILQSRHLPRVGATSGKTVCAHSGPVVKFSGGEA